ncbi:pentapeptide repeat-containing protein [Pseudanabaena sp. PCC 6802]|uniref:pentapeptide repeat-containing protein n=1 Tax=Pseudanabaena sp. PCC 6802 TaxID=118173 RepID=UPI0003468831|nr:pentapeptide repeat-containing protein [Pseudanabaena sp. PCC 6802]
MTPNQAHERNPGLKKPGRHQPAEAASGNFASIKARFASDRDEDKIAALTDALNYADKGRELLTQALEHESFKIKRAAYKLLSTKQKPDRYKLSADELLEWYEAGERDFTGAHLSGTIYHAKLIDIDFSCAYINADIISTNLKAANLSGANLSSAHLNYSNLSRANLSEANLMGADLSDTNLSDANLSNCTLAKANFSNANLSDANLCHAATWDWDGLLNGWYATNMGNLVESSISNTDLRIIADGNGVNFSGANLTGTNLVGVDLKGVQISESTQFDPKWQLVWQIANQYLKAETDLSGADLRGASLPFAKLSGASLSQADLKGANLYRADFQDADLKGANLGRTELQGANLSGANLSGANLKGARLWRADLSNANLRNANLNIANLDGANLAGTELEGANLEGANLQNTTQRQQSQTQDNSPNQQKTWQARFKYWFNQ